MNQLEAMRVLRRSPGRLRLHAPTLSEADARLARLAATEGVIDVRLSQRTGTLLLRFDQSLIDEPAVLALIVTDRTPRHPVAPPVELSTPTGAPGGRGWRRAERVETIDARPAACIAALTDFERYPEWQSHLTAVTILQRDERGRGVRVAIRAHIGDRELQFTTSYRFPSPNRIVFEQDDGQLEAARGSWSFWSLRGGRSRATCIVEIRPGWRLNALLYGPLYEQIREAMLDHFMRELRQRVE